MCSSRVNAALRLESRPRAGNQGGGVNYGLCVGQIPGRKVRAKVRRFEKAIATALVVVGFCWLIFEFAAQWVYLRPEFRQPQPALGYIWATPMKGRYAYLSHAESLLEIYTPTAFGLILGGAFWLDRIRKTRARKLET